MFKVIFTSISTTLIVISFTASIFINSILGAFDLVAMPFEKFNQLQESHNVIDKVKKRHQEKKTNVSKKFVKRSSKKIASSAVSAATIGTAGVVITVAGLEAHSYCEDKKEIQEDGNLLYGTDIKFDFKQCLIGAKEESSEIIFSVRKAVPKIVDNAWEETKEISSETWESVKNTSTQAWTSALETSSDFWNSLTE
jgi:hypothetical protein